ncbi:MAG: PTS galactitol transporter subunit IIC [Arachnia sp.]
METLNQIVQWILALGPSVLMPVIIFLLALAFRLPPGKALRAGLLVGVGFIGINLVVGLLSSSLGGASQAMVERTGRDLSVLDVGWPVAATIAWADPSSALLIPLVLGANALLLVLRLTRTMNIDIWNIWHFAFAGMLAASVTDSILIGLATGVVISVFYLLIADLVAPRFESYFGLPGVTCTTASVATWAPITYCLDWIWERIPGLNKINLNPEAMQRRVGVLADPLVIGIVIGALTGVLAGYDASEVMTLGMSMGAVMLLLPRMVAVLMEGLVPISEGARELMSKWFGKQKVYIGMDAALALGNTANLATAALVIPITVLLAFVLPGNRVLPFVDLASMAYFMVFAVLFNKGNILRGVLNGTILMTASLYLATWIAPVVSDVAHSVDYAFPSDVNEIVALGTGSHWVEVLLVESMRLTPIALPILLVGTLAGMWWRRKRASAETDDVAPANAIG